MRIRHNRYLRPLKGKPKFPRFAVADTETGTRTNKKVKYVFAARPENFILGAVVMDDREYLFYDIEEMKSFFMRPSMKNVIVFFHNAEYDLTTLYGNIYAIDPQAIFSGSKFICATNGNCKFADSVNVLPTSVRDLGEMLGNKKGSPDFNNAKLSEIAEYCLQDCRIVYQALFRAFSMSKAKMTIGSLSVELFRRFFLEKTFKIDTINDEFFAAYYGGRTEIFKKGKVDADVYDINSAYPYVMLTSKFPDPENMRTMNNPTECDLEKLMKTHEGMATLTVTVRDMHIPPLPVRHGSQLIFPVGTFTGSWVFPELRIALPYITIHKVHRIIYAKPIPSPFKKFVTHYYNARLKTDNEFLKYYYKLLLNNLYGKLAQRNMQQSVMLQKGENPHKVMKRYNCKNAELINTDYGDFLIMEKQAQPKSFTVASWAAYITAGVRVMLFNAFTDQVLYCDTDSIFLPKDVKFKHKLSNDLGGWKKERKRVTHIYALKDYDYIDFTGNWTYSENEKGEPSVQYVYVDKRKVKGVKKNSLQLTRFEFEYLRMIKTRESFRRVDGKPAGTFIKQRKKLTGKYTKRVNLKDGKTKPIQL